ncbi:glycosyltransferase family 2 protein [Lactiplantibacillus fabifermentans]|uniref:Teichoic acid polysaccharide glycosyl transferase n=2 Tax=Lactiplantibacillus fabifermentans TaxID=483011 RepID=A0A0R2NSB6_9LACO|nr:glycosyltransferase family 2 protein [Lactiplantibacillus fabifermentans]ETY74339.1 bactoprenol glucosyl transferase [Lactiplantibacillus fabifermentans T30PCM01]KRO28300.1 teichoic acid polysaccharide glycosyl transferase [Lactiplantibacillus fabifermentans DSM 21115]
MKKISIIVPCYNEQESIPLFYQAVQKVYTEKIHVTWPEYQMEYWFIDDGSSDDTFRELKTLAHTDAEHVHYVSFSRNFGKEAALYAGLQHATGELIAVMDVDLQDPPELLPQMMSGILEAHYDIVGTKRVDRKGEPVIRSFFSNAFYGFINKISHTRIERSARDYRLMTRQVVDAVLDLPEYNRFSKGIFSWVGFKTKYIGYENHDRVAGETHWSFSDLVSYSLDGIINFSEKPLAMASFLGIVAFIISIFAMIFIVVRALIFGDPTMGWPSMMTIILMLGGLQLFCIGILGKYVGRQYLEEKHRPIYISKEER